MLESRLKKNWLTLLLLTAGVLLLPFVWQLTAKSESTGSFSAEKVNLALRRTAHLLFVEDGDSTSAIPAVVQTDDYTWQIRLDHAFNYDRLPALLQASLDQQSIRDAYNVAVLKCMDGALQLGYSNQDYIKGGNVPCSGREMEAGCYQLQITFPDLGQTTPAIPLWMWLSTFLLLAAGFFWVGKKQIPAAPTSDIPQTETAWVHFGNSKIDLDNMSLVCGEKLHTLTYREAKLLHYFATQPNQLLERSAILQNVWADEGILVGRSIDVFVSRLRKFLRDDPSVAIVAVHGIGYRLSTS